MTTMTTTMIPIRDSTRVHPLSMTPPRDENDDEEGHKPPSLHSRHRVEPSNVSILHSNPFLFRLVSAIFDALKFGG